MPVSAREHVMVFKGKHWEALNDLSTRELDIEGAIRAGKTTVCLYRELRVALEHPGIHILFARWTDTGVYGLVLPLWRRICEDVGVRLKWHADEEYDELPNGARVYVRGLKAQDQTLRYCVAPETLVLDCDLRWRPAAAIQVGEMIVGVDEHSAENGRRRLQPARVIGTTTFEDERFRIVTTHGEIVTNADHPFLVPSRSRPGKARTGAVWTTVRQLRVGDRIKFLVAPWSDRSDSWMAGLMDGEASLNLSDRVTLAIAQRPGAVLDRAVSLAESDQLAPRLYRAHKDAKHDCQSLVFCRLGDVLWMLGCYRPTRLFTAGRAALLAGAACLPHKNSAAEVLAIEPMAAGPVVGIETSTRTLITNGFVSHNSKFRGLTLSRVYIDQAEEIPHDVYLEVAGRLSQGGDYPKQITISPQSVEQGHWLAKEFPEDNKHLPYRKYIPLSVHDNAHNLPADVVPALMRLYPPEHPKHKTLILGQRGMNVIGEAVYKGAFLRGIHEGVAEYDPQLPLEMALDFGKHCPCVVFRQVSPLGQVRFLGGILGQDLYLDDFCDLVLRYRASWFPNPVEIKECCDPAGTVDTSHGTHGAYKTLAAKGIKPVSRPDSNSPAMRLAAVERLAALMRKRAADRSEAFIVSHSDRWLRVSAESTVVDRFLADGFEAGYVWDEHMVSVNNKQVRKPKKDGWYEHGQNCAEYLELNFGLEVRKKRERPVVPNPYVRVHGEASWAV